ncbi:hypothetical protein AGMMS49991_08300 [Spirochaetia bacterium]|nr:hypothetical protein AGMMS49991_08300 [Spirochaetia bacterium]
MNKKLKKTDSLIFGTLFLIALLFVLSSTYTPFNFRQMHVDSSIYMTITQGIIRGQLPYRDFVDNKGPLMYLLNVPGFMIGSFTGVWITELLLMCITVLFAYKTALFFTGKNKALLTTACTFAAALAFFKTPVGTEEYALPFLMISFYLFVKYCWRGAQKDASFFELAVLGFCLACAVLIRLNMFPLWVGFCLVIFAESIAKRRFALLGKYILGFCIGIGIVFIPVFFYLKANGIVADFLNQVVFGGASRGFGGASLKQTIQNWYIVASRNYSFIPLLWGIFAIIKNYKQKDMLFWTGYTFSYILAVLFLAFSSGDSHYNLTLIPFFVPVIAVLVEMLYAVFAAAHRRNVVIILFLCIVFSEGLMKYGDDFMEVFTNHSGQELMRAGKMIDENTQDGGKIISLGYNGYIYPFTQRVAASKYIYQRSGVVQIQGGSREEFVSSVLTEKPAIIVIYGADKGGYDYLPAWYNPIYKMMADEYELLSDENGFYLFKKKF